MGHVIITGPGRAGTSFLVQLLTRMGQDTGFEPYNEPFDENVRAGCEHYIYIPKEMTSEEAKAHMDDQPKVFKAPDWSFLLKGYLARDQVEIDHMILPFRDFDESAKSRLDAGLDWNVPDEITDPAERLYTQTTFHAFVFGRAVEVAYLYQIPLTIMRYPDFIHSADYCYQRLSRVFDLDYDVFKGKHNELSWKPVTVAVV